jgi:purine-binding chemotaxis protein CheW
MDVIQVDREDVVPVPAFALPVPALFAGALPASAVAAEMQTGKGAAVPQYLLLDGQALRTHGELQALAEVNTQAGGVAGGAASGALASQVQRAALAAQQRQEMITYELFGEEATPIGQIAEILRYDPSMAVFESGGPLLGLLVSRGRSIPVMCLRRMAGMPSGELDDNSSVLVVRSDGDWVGFAVPRLRAIESARWSPELPGSGMGDNDALAQNLHSREMALMDSSGDERMLRVLDLARIASGLRGAGSGAAAPA